MKTISRGACLLLLLGAVGGCYRLDALIAPAGVEIGLAGSPVTKYTTMPGDTQISLPLGIASGDLLIAAIRALPGGTAPAGWELDDALLGACGAGLMIMHRIAQDADIGSTVDIASLVTPSSTYDAVIAAFSGVGQLGGVLLQNYTSASADEPYTIGVPRASAGDHVVVVAQNGVDVDQVLTISGGGQMIGVAKTLYVFDVPLTDPIATSVAITGHGAGCAFARAQTLISAH